MCHPEATTRAKAPRGMWVWYGQEDQGGRSCEWPTGAGDEVGRAGGQLRWGSVGLEKEPSGALGRGQYDLFPWRKVSSGDCVEGGGEGGARDRDRRQETHSYPGERWQPGLITHMPSPPLERKKGRLILMPSFNKAMLTTLGLLVPF